MNLTRYFFSAAGRQGGAVLSAVLALILAGQPDGRAQDALAQAGVRAKRVLMLFSGGKDVPANIMLEEAIRTEMRKGVTNHMEFLSEYLDARHFADEEHFRLFQDYLGKKYAGENPDLIVAFPGRDYTLATELPKALFPGVPVVFVAINEREVPPEVDESGIAGIVQRFDLRGTLGLIVRLQPDTRRVVVIGGTSESDRATLSRIAEAEQALPGVEFEFWTNRPVAELPVAAGSLPEGTVILLSAVQRDVTGQTFFTSQLAPLIAPAASVPVYVLGGWALGSGALGGSVVDPEDLGTRAGKLALRVLNNPKPGAFPIEVAMKGTPMVDWRALRRWGIRESRVPTDGVIRYRPETLWGQHRDLILILVAVFFAQAITIAGLLAQRSQRRRAELEVLNQRTELAHVTRVSTVGQLTSALAHELNQPLGAILRNVEAAEIFLQQPGPDLEEIRAILTDIRKDDERAGSVIEQMRSLLKRRSFELKSLNFSELLTETVALAQSDARARQVTLVLSLPAKATMAQGDRVQLQQVLLNLILNGMDAMAGVAIPGRLLTVRAETDGDGSIEVAVSDCGGGISSADRERLFKPFFTTKANGLGMGLTISKTIIEAHGGKIRVENNASQGVVFKFTLPTEEPQ